MKHQVSGSRRVLLAEFSKLETFAKGTIGSAGTLTLGRITEVISEARVEVLSSMLTARVSIFEATIEPGQALLVPWGYIVCEQCVNQEDTIGFRWTLVGDDASDGFRQLAAYMLPASGGVQGHSTSLLLKKVLDAIDHGKNPSYHGAEAAKAVKDEAQKNKATANTANPAAKSKGKSKGSAVKPEVVLPPAKKRRL